MRHIFFSQRGSSKLIEVAYYIAKLLHTAAVTKAHSLHILQVLSFVLFCSKQTSDKRKLVYWSKREAVEPPTHSSRVWNSMEESARSNPQRCILIYFLPAKHLCTYQDRFHSFIQTSNVGVVNSKNNIPNPLVPPIIFLVASCTFFCPIYSVGSLKLLNNITRGLP